MRALCLSLFLSVSLSLFSQITVTVENTPLRAALKKIEQVSDYKFFYNEKLAGLDQAVTFSVSNATIAQTMQKVLAGKELTYKMESDQCSGIAAQRGCQPEDQNHYRNNSRFVRGTGYRCQHCSERNHQRHYHRCRRKLLIVKRPGELYRQYLLYRLSTVELSGHPARNSPE